MNKIEELFKEIMQETVNGAKAEVNIEIDGSKATCRNKGNTMGMLFAANALIVQISKTKKEEYNDVLRALKALNSISVSLMGESDEQIDVMEAILKNGGKIDV